LVLYLGLKAYDLWMWWNWDEYPVIPRLLGVHKEDAWLNFLLEVCSACMISVVWPVILVVWLVARACSAVGRYRKARLERLGRLKDSGK
jgi:hypothetical protein